MIIRKYDVLPKEAIEIREAVFVEEQGFQEEFDSIDHRATHLVMFDESLPVAVCRYFWNHEKNSYALGRLAVLKDYRGMDLGSRMLEEAEKEIRSQGGTAIYLSSQVRALAFYEKHGFAKVGEIYYEEYCPHVGMQKTL